MDEIKWDPSWNIGNMEIDGQHQKWVEILNRLHQAVLSEGSQKLNDVQRVTLEQILDFTRYHFAAEEKLMQDTAYPEVYNHWRLHREFAKTAYENYRDIGKGVFFLNSDLLSVMKNWLLQHIQIEDKKFGNYLKTLNK
jgi:hemerythrin